MVRRPPLTVEIVPMQVTDLPAVHEIERVSFTTPWPARAYRAELETNRLAHYLVVLVDGRVVGYAGMWLLVDEAHITTFAIDSAWRRRRLGERLLVALLDLAVEHRADEATLEVRLSNLAARRLYEKYGFRPVGLRAKYYSDNQEDALIMTTERLASPSMVERLARLRASLAAEPPPEDDAPDAAAGPAPGSAPGTRRDVPLDRPQNAPKQPPRSGREPGDAATEPRATGRQGAG